jgi:DNA-binding phage protein
MFEVHEQNDLIAAGIAKKIRLTNISKTEIKEKCNISINTINNCLKGNNVNLRSVLAIMAALGMNLKEFVEFAEKNLKEFPKIGDAPRSV